MLIKFWHDLCLAYFIIFAYILNLWFIMLYMKKRKFYRFFIFIFILICAPAIPDDRTTHSFPFLFLRPVDPIFSNVREMSPK